ncbi:hypothetical protein FO519_002868 [Halicephalobus sp. NKZ332]|nr:hypothetical protein FO519_002868 [Halicephalobus sp. NKZ332]
MSFVREDPIDEFELENLEFHENPEKALLRPIIAHIIAEAEDKVDEVELKGLEEFRAEKRKIVEDQRAKINQFYQRKHKQVDVAHKVYRSNKANEARISILIQRDTLLREVLEEARKDLSKISSDKNRYPHILRGLIMQGLLQLMEENIILRCRKDDDDLVKSLLNSVIEEQFKTCGIKPKILIDPQPLSDEITGGVELYAKEGKIMVASTLESRLGLIADQIIPQIRTVLFGSNPNRAFFD